jgi:hypothetical protein
LGGNGDGGLIHIVGVTRSHADNISNYCKNKSSFAKS